jgi:hypothetical protein
MKIIKTAKYKESQEIQDEENCEGCGVSSLQVKLTPVPVTEQEYPGAQPWTFTSYYCPRCLKTQELPQSDIIQENKRGW